MRIHRKSTFSMLLKKPILSLLGLKNHVLRLFSRWLHRCVRLLEKLVSVLAAVQITNGRIFIDLTGFS